MVQHYKDTAALDSLSTEDAKQGVEAPERERVDVWSLKRMGWILLFLLTQTLMGYNLLPAYVLSYFLLLISWNKNRYDFLIMLTIMTGGYTLSSGWGRLLELVLLSGFIGIFIVKKNRQVKLITTLVLLYIGAMFVFAMMSEEVMSIQFTKMHFQWFLIAFYIPLMVFGNREFSIEEFFRTLVPWALMICVFYCVDCYIMSWNSLLPYSYIVAWSEDYEPALSDALHGFLSFSFPRLSSGGMMFFVLLLYPVAKYVKLSWKEWVLVILTFVVCRTMTVTAGLLIGYLVVKVQGKKLWLWIGGILVALPLLYAADSAMGGFLRISSTVDQFISLDEAVSEEELAEFGTGRMAQIIPKYQELQRQKRELIGFGFLSASKSDSHKFVIENELLSEEDDIEEVVAGAVEVTQVETVLEWGYLGLLIQMIVFVGIYLILRPLKYSEYVLSILVATFIMGLGGFGGWIFHSTVMPLAIAIGVVLLANRPPREDKLLI